ncbi:MAG: Hsp20/alpha crystallin family protein [Cyanophyceae cyanobacterium]
MAILRWQPYTNVDSIRRQIDQLFDDSIFNELLGNDAETSYLPSAEIEETDDAIYLRVELPGLNKQDIQVDVSAQSVSVRGERKTASSAGETKRRSEFRYGSFQRTFELPIRVQHTEAKAAYENGVLTLTLPKTEAEKTKVVTLSLDGIDATEASADIAPEA